MEKVCYYIRDKHGFEVADSVQELISFKLEELGLSKSQCTMVGFSKGASAALYHSLKYDFPNVAVSAPRIHLGSGNLDRKYILDAMTQSSSRDEVSQLDEIIPQLLESSSRNKNIYLFSSLADHFHKTESGVVLSSFRKFDNFNLVLTESDLVRKHKDVTLYNLHLILSLLGMLGDGIAPGFGEVSNGRRSNGTDNEKGDKRAGGIVSAIEKVSFASDSSLSITGHAFIEGLPVPESRHVRTDLILKTDDDHVTVRGVQTLSERLTSRYYRDRYVDYSYGGNEFRLSKSTLNSLASGVHDLSLSLVHAKRRASGPWGAVPSMASHMLLDSNFYLFLSAKGRPKLIKMPWRDAEVPIDVDRRLTKLDVNDRGFLDIRGRFRIDGLPMPSLADVAYYVCFVSNDSGLNYSEKLYASGKVSSAIRDGNHQPLYKYAGFASLKYRGLDLSRMLDGQYSIYIVSVFGDQFLNSLDTNRTVRLSKGAVIVEP